MILQQQMHCEVPLVFRLIQRVQSIPACAYMEIMYTVSRSGVFNPIYPGKHVVSSLEAAEPYRLTP